MSKEIKNFIGKKVIYDKDGQFIWGVTETGDHQKLADLRGWGAIQNLFNDNRGDINLKQAAKFQDELGEWIVDAINKKLNAI